MERDKKILLAIIISLLICCVNAHVLVGKSSNWIHAGGIVIVFGFVVLIHIVLLFILIGTAKKPSRQMARIWTFFIILYFIPAVISYFNNIPDRERKKNMRNADQRIREGTATIDDFAYLHHLLTPDEYKYMFLHALREGYPGVAEELLTIVCDSLNPLSDRIYATYDSVTLVRYKEKYGNEGVRGKELGTWLIDVVREGLYDGAVLLLDAGADVNVYSSSPLMAAVVHKRPDFAHLLLERGADINIADEYGHDALFCAVKYNQVDIVRLLIEYGADIERKYKKIDDQSYESLLYFAQQEENSEMVEFLTSEYQKREKEISTQPDS